MRVVHFSDWHWSFSRLPPADLYVCTGDMYANFPTSGSNPIDPATEIKGQEGLVHEVADRGGFRQCLESPDSPIVCVRGNHDFIPLTDLFTGCNLVHEFIDNEVVEVLGMRVTGHRGIPRIHGTWNDETERSVLAARVNAMPEADLFLTHYPPLDVLDFEVVSRGRIEHYGLEGMREALVGKMGDRGLHCFGHIHGCGGIVKGFGPGQFVGSDGPCHTFSNAACHVNEMDI
jgi:Icc-related predicted phosphoesterase